MEFRKFEAIKIYPIGKVVKGNKSRQIKIFSEYEKGLLGLIDFSHIIIFYWFHKNDFKVVRKTLKVHPYADSKKSLIGVFATCSPVRPNLLAFTICELLDIKKNLITIKDIDALDGSPVIDIKGYFPNNFNNSKVSCPKYSKKK